jgi:hypothetical protein
MSFNGAWRFESTGSIPSGVGRDSSYLIGKIMPSWEAVKTRLDGMAERLLNE